jgi:hypothetical protein
MSAGEVFLASIDIQITSIGQTPLFLSIGAKYAPAPNLFSHQCSKIKSAAERFNCAIQNSIGVFTSSRRGTWDVPK